MSVKDGGPAFPSKAEIKWHGETEGADYQNCGMTLRDWFAGQALIAVMGTDVSVAAANKLAQDNGKQPAEMIASIVYEQADAMLSEREKKCS